MSLSIAVDIVITGSVHVAPEGTRSVDRNGNFFEKGVREVRSSAMRLPAWAPYPPDWGLVQGPSLSGSLLVEFSAWKCRLLWKQS